MLVLLLHYFWFTRGDCWSACCPSPSQTAQWKITSSRQQHAEPLHNIHRHYIYEVIQLDIDGCTWYRERLHFTTPQPLDDVKTVQTTRVEEIEKKRKREIEREKQTYASNYKCNLLEKKLKIKRVFCACFPSINSIFFFSSVAMHECVLTVDCIF